MTKPLLPTLRERNRYLVFEIISDYKFNRDEIVKSFWNSIMKFLGEHGVSKTSFWVLEWNGEKQRGILKVNHKSVDDVRAALTLIREINGRRVIFHTRGVSGTLKKARERFM
ncbi:MAG: ribonuclease P protein component 2 [Candidatus Altiarchaeales archaeon]|nr:MAG: ribonuclease P protein component 2 [Candidatus Altiarchaeales archaeon]RLI95292.1 MAG: ribonuclease P protein component 2 [Candidatus Altiarchaeales archaeon]RLI95522.1 MAG: ribonuclease P protein component 2 [Candidatus Altiarchaeales archaeon]HDO82462.1 ribonuclease P protein component 2 [Candidatus Altiarchaeales archaeon]HEX55111.1 ribonuclease P protein component 2 [Candidatus Altiarchaeales archaeon]